MRTLSTFPSVIVEAAALALAQRRCPEAHEEGLACEVKVTQADRDDARAAVAAALQHVPDDRTHIVQLNAQDAARLRAFMAHPNGSQWFGDDYYRLIVDACGAGILFRTSRT